MDRSGSQEGERGSFSGDGAPRRRGGISARGRVAVNRLGSVPLGRYNSAMLARAAVVLGLLPALGSLAAAQAGPRLLLTGATVVRTDGSAPIDDAAVLLQGDRIVAVGPRATVAAPADATIVDVRGKWLVPGLVDAHVHFFQSAGIYTRPDIIELRTERSYEAEQQDIDARLPDTLARYVRCGITTVVDVGGPDRNFAIRARAREATLAPTVYCTGRLLTTWLPPAFAKLADPPFAPVQTAEQCAAEVERQAALGADLIKVWYIVRRPQDVQANRPLLDATVAAASKRGLRVAVHATQQAAAREAIAAGARILVHSVEDTPVDAGFVAALANAGTTYVPTLMVIEGYAEVLGLQRDLMPIEWQLGQPEVIGTWLDLERLARADAGLARRAQSWRGRLAGRDVLFANLRAVRDGKGRVAAGTDAGNIGTLHGPSLHRELALMVEAGMTPAEVLVAATRGGAAALGKEAEFGDIATGMRADLLVLAADPRQDIAALQQVEQVVLRGKALPIADTLRETPAQVVQRQLNAYNARDLERFAACYADDVVVGNLGPDGPAEWMRGKDKLRERWGERFATSPDLHCRIENRIANGEVVIDHEFVTGVPGRDAIHAVAVYRVKDGRIASVWFVR